MTPLALAGQLGGYSGRGGRYPSFPLDAHTAGTQTVACRFAVGGHACKFPHTKSIPSTQHPRPVYMKKKVCFFKKKKRRSLQSSGKLIRWRRTFRTFSLFFLLFKLYLSHLLHQRQTSFLRDRRDNVSNVSVALFLSFSLSLSSLRVCLCLL